MAKPKVPSDSDIKAAVELACSELSMKNTANAVCALVTVRMAEHFGWTDGEQRTEFFKWLYNHGHGIASNASQLGQWCNGKGEKADKVVNVSA